MQPLVRLSRLLPVLLMAAVGIALTLASFWTVREEEYRRHALRFEQAAEAAVEELRSHVGDGLADVEFLGRLMRALTDIDLDRFNGFTRLAIDRGHWLRALQWVPRVTREQRATLEARARAEGLTGFRIVAQAPDGRLVPAPDRAVYFPVQYVMPLQGNEAALGFDLASEPERRAALMRARDTGTLVASDPLHLVQAPRDLGFLVFMPIYRDLPASPTVAERREGLIGFVLGVYSVPALIQGTRRIWGDEHVRLHLELSDPALPEGRRRIYRDEAAGARTNREPPSNLTFLATVPVADRTWQVRLTPPQAALGASVHGTSAMLLFFGLIATTAICAYVWRRNVAMTRVEALIAERTSALIDATAAVEDREQRLQAVLDTTLDGIVTIDAQGIIRVINPAAANMFGYTPAELRGQHVSRIMPQSEAGRHEGDLSAYLRSGDANVIGQDREVQGRRKDHSLFPLGLRVAELRIGNEQFYTGVLRDLSEVRAAEAALQASQARLRMVVTGTPIILFAMNRDGVFTLSEGKGLQLLGREPGEVVGQSVEQVYANHPQIIENVQRALAGEAFSTEVLAQGRWTEAHYAPTYDSQGQVDGVIGVAFDITERKRAEQLKAEFVSTVSHELRTPLASIVGYVELILDEEVGPVTDEMREFLSIVAQNGDRLTQLINDILDIEKLETGRVTLRSEPTDLSRVLDQVAVSLKVLADKKELTLDLDMTPERKVLGDPDRLTQLFSNLVSNAIKYTKSGSVRITGREQDGCVVVEIADTGIGMSQATLAQLFTRFFRADNEATRAIGGTGLGLAIAKAIAIQHGGTIDARSTVGVGSVFTVRLPSLAAAVHTRPPPGPESEAGVLIVGGPPDFAGALAGRLAEAGWACRHEPDLEALPAILAGSPPRVLVIQSPTGPEAAMERLRALPEGALRRPVPVVVVCETGTLPDQLAEDGLAVVSRAAGPEPVVEAVLRHARSGARRALILDDDPDFSWVLERTLARHGIAADRAGSAEAALEACRAHPYDLVLLDYYLPDMSGLDVLRKLQDGPAPAPAAVLISGSTLDRTVEAQAQALGSLAFLNKKIGVGEIARVVFAHLSRSLPDDDAEDRAGG